MSELEFSGKSALVTGGTSGIGEATVRRFARGGAVVTFTGTNYGRAEEISKETGATFGHHDVSDESGWPAVINETVRRNGRLDIAFANAGTTTDDGDIETVSVQAWRRIIDVNATGAMLTCHYAIAAMKQNPGGSSGSIIINSSIVAMQSLPGYIAYTVSKGALRSLAKGVASHCAKNKLNIRCNSIHPGNTATPNLLRAAEATDNPQAAIDFLSSFSPLERLASPDEIADLVAYLAGNQSSFVTGAEILIDGGTLAGMGSV